MALKVVPAGDERCDIHNVRRPAAYICENCLAEMGVESSPAVTPRRGPIRRARRALRRGPIRHARHALRRARSGGRRKGLIAAGIGLAVAAVVVTAVVVSRGGGDDAGGGPPTQAEVVSALDLSPNPSGTGWITLDGACAVPSILIGTSPTPPSVSPGTLATNESGTVRAVVLVSFSLSQAACVDRIRAALRDHF